MHIRVQPMIMDDKLHQQKDINNTTLDIRTYTNPIRGSQKTDSLTIRGYLTTLSMVCITLSGLRLSMQWVAKIVSLITISTAKNVQ